MFSPEGFVSAVHLYERCHRLALAEIRFTKAEKKFAREGSNGLPGNIFQNIYFARETFAAWAVWSILHEQPIQPYLASPQGAVVAASYTYFQGHPASDVPDFSPLEPSRELTDWIRLWHGYAEGDDDNAPWESVLFICQESWTVRSIDEISARLGRTEAAEKAPAWRRYISPFQGWAVCFRMEDIPDDDGLLSMLTDMGADIVISLPEQERKPSLRTAAGQAFDRLFPHGRQGMEWKVVAKRIEAEIGRQVSVKTLTRAVGDRLINDNTEDSRTR